jgi:uncharacterized protein YndB with AHSA1/START domain
MVVSGAVNSGSFKVTTPSDQEIRMTRLFDAPRILVFDAMTKPEHVRQWWGCLGEGYSVPVCEIDLRPGGAWRFVNRHPKGEAAFHGEYREIAPPSRLVFTEIFEAFPDTVSVVTAELTEEGAGRARCRHRIRHGARRGDELRPPRGSRRRAAAVLTSRSIAVRRLHSMT